MPIRSRAARVVGLLLVAACAALSHAPSAGAAPETPALDGANDWSCRPTGARPEPVVLVHGSGTDIGRSFPLLAPAIRAEGHCVFAANLGAAPGVVDAVSGQSGSSSTGIGPIGAALLGRAVYGVADIDRMAVELAEVVRSVRETTGASRVALVGHSTGGTVIRQYLRARGAEAVSRVVTLGTPYRGTTWDGLRAGYPDLAALGLGNAQIAAQVFGTPGQQQVVGSPLLNRLNTGGETVPGVRYTAIASRADRVITPQDTAVLAAPAAADRNVWLQDGCPGNTADHSGMLEDPRAAAAVLSALAGDQRALPC
ncbi:esterase/lipase family protein [Nocardia gamkensis]|uniref:Alpha/beta fold hydrolase n=1 Tax=Nocardia gamkensis TaxID=352869 RepID=A0A7X6L948_9NOCA|nr:alpha/beta fold hydrolase [Nocardia gamkensis]NKY30126.1 alpha/beta fold hydrolase [Nocardia gamkensis]NQE70900.1 Triacylglycerol lipase [Nocardia gamkensis]